MGSMIISCLVFLGFALIQPAYAETVNVGVEPFPPLINEDGTGYSIIMLREVERISDLKFDIKIMPYNRAKVELQSGKMDLIGHTPHRKETKEFYEYAQDLDWAIKAITDIYSVKKERISKEAMANLKTIGTPRGNQDFYSEQFGIPLDRFHEGNIDNLLKMLQIERIEAFIFERASTMATLRNLGIDNVCYRTLDDSISASFGVRKDAAGQKLKEKLDQAINKLDIKKIFQEYAKFTELPPEGVVRLK